MELVDLFAGSVLLIINFMSWMIQESILDQFSLAREVDLVPTRHKGNREVLCLWLLLSVNM
jgi:hypothetical protein